MKEKEEKNTIVDEENNPYTMEFKIDVLGMLKNMELKDQEELIDWIIEKINERSSITMENNKLMTNFRDINKLTVSDDNVSSEFIKKD